MEALAFGEGTEVEGGGEVLAFIAGALGTGDKVTMDLLEISLEIDNNRGCPLI